MVCTDAPFVPEMRGASVHFEVPERIREQLARAGLGGLSDAAILALAGCAAAVLVVAVWRFWPGESGTAVEVIPAEETVASVLASETTEPAVAEVVVHVVGAVRSPGVYTLAAGSRVEDAIEAAGGQNPDAAGDSINLARVLQDGEQLVLPTKAQVASGEAPGAGATAAGGGGVGGGTSGGKVNLNRATVAELDTLPGVGPATAQKIVDDRTKNGPFKKVEDLMRVTGIGAKKFES